MDIDFTKILKNQASNDRVLEAFFVIAQCRYITFQQLKTVKKKWAEKVTTKTNLTTLSKLEYLVQKPNNVYHLAPKAFKFLRNNRYETLNYQSRLRALPAEHTLRITDLILEEMEDDNFYTVIYPFFKFFTDLIKEKGDVYDFMLFGGSVSVYYLLLFFHPLQRIDLRQIGKD